MHTHLMGMILGVVAVWVLVAVVLAVVLGRLISAAERLDRPTGHSIATREAVPTEGVTGVAA